MTLISPDIRSSAFLAKIAIALSLLCLGLYLVSIDSFLASVSGIVIIGSMFAHAVELQHQCLHNTAFKSRAANRIVGILLGIPMLSSFHAYRRSHMDHHRKLGTPDDTAYFSYRFLETPSVAAFLHDLFGVAHLRASLSAILLQGKSRLLSNDRKHEEDYTSKRVDYAIMAFALACVYLYSITTGSDYFLKAWAAPFLLVGQPIHFLIELPEHIGCSSRSPDPLRNTRSITGSWLSRWFTNGNNFHVEHHLLPALSMDQLSDVFQQCRGRHLHVHGSYLDFYLSALRLARSHIGSRPADQSVRRPT